MFTLSLLLSDVKGVASGLSQNDPNCPRVAQHALVLGPDQPFTSDSIQAPASKRSGDQTLGDYFEKYS